MPRRRQIVEAACVCLVLGLALFLRVRHLDTTSIWGDQSFTVGTAMRWVNGGAVPLAANKSSAGFVNPPMIEYLYAAALGIWPDILSVAALTMVSGFTAVVGAGWAAWRVFGKGAALWTMLVFAANPWGVFYSQLIWNQTMVPVFSSLTLACLLLYFAVEQRPAYLILSFVWSACMTQVHPSTISQVLAIGLICALFWRKVRAWPLAVGSAAFVLLYVPFLLYERGVGWMDVRTAFELARQPSPLSPASVLVSLDLLHARGLPSSIKYASVFDGLATVLLALSLAGAVWTVARTSVRRRRDAQADRKRVGLVIVLLWFAVPILAFARSGHYLQLYYLIGQVPAHFVLIGTSLASLQDLLAGLAARVRRQPMRRAGQVAARALVPLPLVALAIWQTLFNLQFQTDRALGKVGPTQIRHVRAAVQMSGRLLAERPACSLVVVSRGHNVEVSELSLLREFLPHAHVLLADGELAMPLPAPCAVYLDAWPGSRASTWLGSVAAPIGGAAIPVLDRTWQFYEIPADLEAELTRMLEAGDRREAWANGLVLTGYEAGPVQPGTTLPLTLTWFVEAQAPEVIYHLGTYLLAEDDQVVAQSDGPGFDSIQWQAGDRFLTWFEIAVPGDLPAGEYRIAVAVYSWPALERVGLVAGGNTVYLGTYETLEP